MIGAYIKLFGSEVNGKNRYLLELIFSYLIIVGATMYIRQLSLSNSVLTEYIYAYSKISSIFVFVSAFSLFLFFKGLQLGKIKFIG